MVRHGMSRGVARRHRWTAAILAAVIGFPMVLAQSTAVHFAAAATTTTDIRLDVISARDSTLRPARGEDPCAPYRGMHLLTPFTEVGAPTGCALSRNDAGAHVTNTSTTVTDTHILATDIGATVTGTGIPADATVTSAIPGVSFELSDAGTANFTGTIHLARSNPAPFTYHWLINLDNTGDPHQPSTAKGIDPLDTTIDGSDKCRPYNATTNPDGDPAFPANCYWPSIHSVQASPVITQGDSTMWDLNGSVGNAMQNLPAGKYLVSVSADGFEIGGAHFTMPMPVVNAGPGIITVGLNPYPIPLGTIQVKVFQDQAPADGTFDQTTEHGLAGWIAKIEDILPGNVASNWFGDPICSEYKREIPAGLLAKAPPNPPQNPMSPTQALAFYGAGGPAAARADATAFYGGGDPNYVFSLTDFYTWGVSLVDGAPQRIPGTGGKCISDADGIVRIPDMGTNRYSITVSPPNDTANEGRWAQTTTLEGAHDSDFWLMSNDSGLDTEMVQAGEPVPWAQFGFVDLKNEDAHGVPQPWPLTAHATGGEIKGTVLEAEPYVPGQGGLPGQGGANGQSGIRYPHILDRVKIALNDFDNGDLTGYVTENKSDGTFDIKNVKDGTYLMSFWDIDQDYAFDAFNVSVVGGQMIDLGNVPLIGWFTQITGKVFIDSNSNGKLDPGEKGVPNFDVTLKNRTNDMMVSGQNVATSDFLGDYDFKEAYPAGSFVIQEFFNTRYKTTGLTYQADNDPNEHTVLTAAVDISLLPIIGQNGRVDIGVLPYDTAAEPCADTCQGGIVATVVYDATRNELQAGKAATESYEPGIPGIPVNIALPVKCGTDAGVECDEHGRYEVNSTTGEFLTNPVTVGPDTSYDLAPGNVSDDSATYVTEDWHRPDSCLPRDSDGNIVQQTAIQTNNTARNPHDCIEATELATTWGFADGDVGATDGQQVDGNYGFVTNHPGDYVVSVDIPTDPIFHNPLYKMRDEAPINVFTGDVYVPQDSDLHGTTFQSFLKFNRADPSVPQLTGPGLREADSTSSPYPDSNCIGPLKQIFADDPVGHPETYNPDLHNTGGSPSEGMWVHDCSMKLIHVEPGQSVAPNFNLWTDVPAPAKYWGYVTDDVSVSTDRRSTALGEVQGVADVPVGLYDWTNRLLYETDTDYNGLFEVLMPSTNSYNCPVPAGPCSGMYRFVGNDPGQPQHPNTNYNPVYKTIAANFQAWPGIFTSADTAPTRVMVQIEGPGSQFAAVVICKAADSDPQIFHTDWPFVPNPNTYTPSNNEATGQIEVYGNGFGTATGSVSLTPVDVGTSPPAGSVTVSNWSNTHFTLTLQLTGSSSTSVAGGAYELQVKTAGGLTTVNGLTIHVLKSNYTTVNPGSNVTLQARFPDVAHVGPLSKLRLLDIGTNELAPNNPYNNWGQTNKANMFTPTDPSKFFFPGPIQKAINYEWGRWLNVGPLLTAIVNALFPVHNEAWALAMQAAGNSALNQLLSPHKHPLIMVYPRLDQNPTTGAPAIDPFTHAASFDPNDPALAFNANGAYYESPVMFYPFKLQGTGPGGIYPDTTGGATGPTPAYGSVIDGQYFNAATNKAEPSTSDQADGTDPFTYDPSLFAEPYAALWENFVVFQLGQGATVTDPTIPAAPNPMPTWFGYGWDGQQAPTEGQVLYVLAHNGDYGTTASHAFRAAIDGLTVTGGDQLGFPGNRNEVGGGAISNAPGETGTAPDENFVLDIQGGAMMVNAFARYLQITNNSVIANSGASGAIRIGTPQLGTDTEDGNPEGDPVTGETFPAYDQQNTDVHIAYNRVVGDGGTSLGGALSIFNGSERYRVDHNQFCGNFSAEYGGAISHFGLSKHGEIDHNKIYLNESVDEGAGIMIAGEPQLDAATAIPIPGKLSNGSGQVSVHDNYISANLAGDDGGGLRFLQAGNWQADVYNNMITDNVSTHEGGGIALDDSTNVRIYNNTIAKNITTATAVTSTGAPAPAGLSTGDNSTPLMDCVANAPTYTRTRGRTTNNSAIFQLQGGTNPAPNTSNFTAADLGATLVAPNIPEGAKIVAVAADGRSVTLSEAATATNPTGTNTQRNAAPGVTFSVYRACDGMPPQVFGLNLPKSFSDPLLFNDLFDDNRAGNWQSTGTVPGIHGVGLVTVPAPETINEWDMGSADGAGLLSPTNSVINSTTGYNASPTNIVHTETVHAGDPASSHNIAKFVAPFDIGVSVSPWRIQPRFRPAAIVGVSLPANAIGDYHLLDATSPAADLGAASKAIPPFSPPTVNAPSTDIDNDPRAAPIDTGADEVRTPIADLTITKTHSPAGSVGFGAAVTYTVTVHNNGPDNVTSAPVTDNFPVGVTVNTWTCSATAGNSCTTTGSGNSLGGTVTLVNGGTATFTATTNAQPVTKTLPTLGSPLDNFTRANANNLGANWTQPAILGVAAIRVNASQAQCLLTCAVGPAYWSPATFGPKQGAAFTFAATGSPASPAAPITGSELLMAVSGSPTGSIYPSGVRVQYASGAPSTITNTASVAPPAGMVDPNATNNSQSDNLNLTGNRVLVSWTTNSGGNWTDLGSLGIPTGSFANGNTLQAVINTNGTVDVWKINGGTTYLGSVSGLSATFTTNPGRVGMLLANNQRIDDFKGATVP